MEKIYNLYQSILKFAGYRVDEEGYIHFGVSKTKSKPLFINDKAVVMPYQHHLNKPDGKMIFHPLCENFMRGESEIIKKLTAGINIRFNMVLALLVPRLLQIVASPIEHAKLTPSQLDLITTIKEVDDTCVRHINRVVREEITKKPTSYFISLFLKKGGVYQGGKYSRVGLVRFPFYEKIGELDLKYIREKDKEAYRQVFQYVFPEIDEQEAYNYGTNDRTAPFLVALMMTAANVASRLNDVLELYEEFLEDEAEDLKFDADWMDYVMDLSQLQREIRLIPPQSGNEGSISVKEQNTQAYEVKSTSSLEAPTPTPPAIQQPTPTPVETPNPKPLEEVKSQPQKRGVSINELMQKGTHPQYGPNPLQAQIAEENWKRMNDECVAVYGYPVPQGYIFDLNTRQLVPMAPQYPQVAPYGQPQLPMGQHPMQQGHPHMQPRPSTPGVNMPPPAPWRVAPQMAPGMMPGYGPHPTMGSLGYPPPQGYPTAPMGYPPPPAFNPYGRN